MQMYNFVIYVPTYHSDTDVFLKKIVRKLVYARA